MHTHYIHIVSFHSVDIPGALRSSKVATLHAGPARHGGMASTSFRAWLIPKLVGKSRKIAQNLITAICRRQNCKFMYIIYNIL